MEDDVGSEEALVRSLDKLLDKKTAHDIIDRLFYDLGQVGLRAIRVRLLRSICGVLILFSPPVSRTGWEAPTGPRSWTSWRRGSTMP